MKLKQTNIQQCPYCHSAINDQPTTLLACHCGAIYHHECANILRKCATCDVAFKLEAPPPIEEPPAQSRFKLGDKSFWNKQASLVYKKLWADEKFQDALKVARANTKGKLWLVGGKLYRNLICQIYRNETNKFSADLGAGACDFDFLGSKLTWFTHIPDTCYREYTKIIRYGYDKDKSVKVIRNPFKKSKSELGKCPRFTADDMSIDIVSLDRASGILNGKLPKTIEGYFMAVPMSIQACALDLDTEELLISEACEASILHKTVWINNKKELERGAARKCCSQPSLLREKAASLCFNSKFCKK